MEVQEGTVWLLVDIGQLVGPLVHSSEALTSEIISLVRASDECTKGPISPPNAARSIQVGQYRSIATQCRTRME